MSIDKLFSYWALGWFLLYYVSKMLHSSFIIPSPKLAIYVALFENMIEFISLTVTYLDIWKSLKFMIMMFFLKFIPLYLVRNVPIKIPKDIYILSGVFCVYVLYLHLIGTSLVEVYRETNKSLSEGKNDTPFYKFIDWIYNLQKK